MCVYVYTDIKECDIGTHNCSQQCIELPGGFKCSCGYGYQLQEDEITCKGITLFLMCLTKGILKYSIKAYTCLLKYSIKAYICCVVFWTLT